MGLNELVETLIRKNRRFNHYITIIPEAKQRKKGVLNGMPIPVKDVIYTKGVRTTAASLVLEKFVPSYSATIIEKIEANGGVVVGKTNTHEFAMGPSTTSHTFGPARNPHNLELITGGSSGGSAGTVGADDVPVAIGTDTGGSVRMPAALCGVYGFKPTLGRISRFGVIPVSWSMDCVGILARNINDLVRVYDVVRGYDPKDPTTVINEVVKDSESKEVKVIGIVKELCDNSEVEREFNQFVDDLSSKYRVEFFSLPKIMEMGRFRILILSAEAAAYHSRFFATNEKKYGKDVLRTLRTGFQVSAYDYVNAQRLRNLLSEEIFGAFAKYDLLVSPTVTIRPPRIRDVVGQEQKWVDRLTKNTSPFSMAGVPAISIPIAKDVGIQLIANSGEDLALLNFVRELEVN